MSLLLLPSAANLDLIGDVFPFTLCLLSLSLAPLTRPPLTSCSLGVGVTSPWPLLRCVGVLWPLELRPERDRTLACLDWVGVVSLLLSPLPRLLGVGVLLPPEPEVTGVDTVLSWEMVDCWELRDGDLWVLLTSRLPSSPWNKTIVSDYGKTWQFHFHYKHLLFIQEAEIFKRICLDLSF